MNSRPVKILNANGDIKRFTAPEENFVAYQASLRLAYDDSDKAAQLSTLSGTTIGSFTDTFFNQSVGAHPGSALSTGSTTYTVKQRTGSNLDSDSTYFRAPINVNNVGGNIAAMSQAEWKDLSFRLAKIITTNEYPGTYRLGSSTPSGDYSVHLSNVFVDTQTDGTNVNYNIYKRTAMTAPTKVNPLSLRKINGDSGAYDGIQAMDSDQMVYTFGEHLKRYIMSSSNNIGAYQIRSSAQGAPSVTGTWTARGTATDTKKQTTDTDYAGDYAGNYIGDFTGDYIGDFVGEYTRNSTNDSTVNSTATSTRNSTSVYTGNYTGDFVGTYTGNFIGDFTGNFLGPITYTGDFVGTYTGDFTGDFIGDFTGDYSGIYTNPNAQDFVADAYVGNFTGPGPPLPITYLGNYTGNYLGPDASIINYTRTRYSMVTENDYIGNYAAEFYGNFEGAYTRNSTTNSTVNSTATQDENFTSAYTNADELDSTANSTRNSTADAAENFTTVVAEDYTGDFTGNYIGDFTGNFIGDFIGNYEGIYTTNSTVNSTTTYEGNYTGNYFGETIVSASETVETYTLYVRVS
tara:strand:+ start:14014 stop:15732 length:1719 start_codon:yes stop_codon:yes gene_type:complete